MRSRIAEELALLRQFYQDVRHAEHGGDDWFLIPRYRSPQGWTRASASVVEIPITFFVTTAHPMSKPYAFMVPHDLRWGATVPNNAGGVSKAPPFSAQWMQLSWDVEDWKPHAEIAKGSNLLTWARSFANRLKEGA